MELITVKGKNIPLYGVTDFLVQGEVAPEEKRFLFNTKGEHSLLASADTWKVWYKRRDNQGLAIPVTKTVNQDGTWYLSWFPDNHVTYLNGQFIFLIAAYTGQTELWKTTACCLTIARSVDPQIIDPNEKTLSYDNILTEFNNWVSSNKGVANGLASLDSNGKVPSSQLPSYVDDVLEFNSKSAFPATGETGKIYVAKDYNKTYRWGGTEYVEISASLALGETESTAYRGDRGKTAYDHSQDGTVHVTSSDKSNWNGKSVVSVSSTGTATETVDYITINGVEKKIKGGVGTWNELSGKPFSSIGSGLTVESNALKVDVVDTAQEDNTKPITSNAVAVTVGNINALLALI